VTDTTINTITLIVKADPDQYVAAHRKSNEIVHMLARVGLTPRQARFHTLNAALHVYFENGTDTILVIYPGGAGLPEHGFHYSLFRKLDHKPGMSKEEAYHTPELEGYTHSLSGGLVPDIRQGWLDNPRSNGTNWVGWFFHE
jgi:hypothetical protein